MKRRGEEEDESGKDSEIEEPYLELPNATPLGAACHVAHSFCEVPASREAQVDTQLLRHIQAGHLLSDSKPHATILIAGRCGRLRKLFDRFAFFLFVD